MSTASPTVKVHCHGRRPDGRPCDWRAPIAEIEPDGRAVVRDHGRQHVVTETTCPRCGSPRSFGA